MSSPSEILVGQRINSSAKSVASALRARDAVALQALARTQAASGATALDLNVSAACARAAEPALLAWLALVIQEISELPLCLDSGDVHALAEAAAVCRTAPIVNSLSPDQIDAGVLDLFEWRREGRRAVVLCTRRELAMDVQTRLRCARYAAGRLLDLGLREDALIFDPLMFPKLSGAPVAETMFETMRRLREIWPEAGILCASGNYSHGLTDRRAAELACVNLSRRAGANVFLCDPRVFSYNFR